jgi:hypothetical protein
MLIPHKNYKAFCYCKSFNCLREFGAIIFSVCDYACVEEYSERRIHRGQVRRCWRLLLEMTSVNQIPRAVIAQSV